MVNSRSEFDLEKRIHLTNEVPPYDLFEAVNSVFQTDFWKYILGSTTIEFDLPYKTLKQDGSYERVPDNENVYYKKVNGVLSQNYGPIPNDDNPTYHRMEVDGVLMPEFDLLLHEVYRYTGYPYPDHPDYNKLLTNNEFNDYINSAAAVIDYKPDNRFFENVIDTLYNSNFLSSKVSKEDEVAMIKIRNLTNEAFRRKLYGSKFGYRMLANDIFENITTYPLATYLPVFNEKIDNLNSEVAAIENEKLYKDRLFDNFRKSRKIDTFSPIYQNKFKLIDWMGDKSVYPEEKDNSKYFTGTSLPFYNYEIFEVPSVDDTKSVANSVKLSEFIENSNQDLDKQGLVSELYAYPYYYSTLDEDLKSIIKKDTVIEAHSIRTDFENDIRYNIIYKYDTIEHTLEAVEDKEKFTEELKDQDLFTTDKNYLNTLYKYTNNSFNCQALNVIYNPFNKNTLILDPADTISFYPEYVTGVYNDGVTILDKDYIDWEKAAVKKEQILSTKQYNSNTYTGMETVSQVIGFTKGKIDFSCIKEDMYSGTSFTQNPSLSSYNSYGIIINNSENNKVVFLGKAKIDSLFENGLFYIKNGTFEITAIPEEKTESMMRACYKDYDDTILLIQEKKEYLETAEAKNGFEIEVAVGFNEGKSEFVNIVNSHEEKDLYLQFCEKVLEYTDLLDKIKSYRKNKEYIYREKSFNINGKPNVYNSTLINNENIIDGFMIGAASYDNKDIIYSRFAAIARSTINYITLGYLSILPFIDNDLFSKEQYYQENTFKQVRYLKVKDALLQDNEDLNVGLFSEMTDNFINAVVFEDCIKVSSIDYDTIRIMSEIEAEGYTISFKDDKAVDLYRTLSIGDKVTGPLIDSDDNDVKIVSIGEKYVTVDRKLTKIGKAELVYSIKMNIIGEELDDYPDSYQAYLRKNGTYSSYSPLDNGIWPSEKWPNASLALTDGLLDITYFNVHNYKAADDKIGSFINVMERTHLTPAENEVLVPSTIKCMRDLFVELNLTKIISGPDEKGKTIEKLSDYRWLDYIEDNLPRTSRLTDNVNIGVNLTMQTDTSGYMSTISGANYTDPLTKVKFITINQDGSFKWPESTLSDTEWTVPMYAQIGSGGAGRDSWFRTPEDIVYPNIWGNNVYDGVIEGQAPIYNADGTIEEPGLIMQIEAEKGRFRKRSVWAKDGALLETDLSSPEYLSTEEPLFEVQLGEYNTQTHFFRELDNTMTTVQVSFYKQAFKNLIKEFDEDEKIKVSNKSILDSKAISKFIEAYDMEKYTKVEKTFDYKGQWTPALILKDNSQEINYPSKVDNDINVIEYYTIENDYNLIYEDSAEDNKTFSNGSILFVYTKDNGESEHDIKSFSCINVLANTNGGMSVSAENEVSLYLLKSYHSALGLEPETTIKDMDLEESIDVLKNYENAYGNNETIMAYDKSVCWFLYIGNRTGTINTPTEIKGFNYDLGTLFAFTILDGVIYSFTLDRNKRFVFSQDMKKYANVAEEYMNILLGISNSDEFNELSIVNNIDKANYYFDLPKKYIAEGSYNIKTIINPEFISRGYLYNDDNTIKNTEVSFITTDSAVFYDEANAEFFVYARYYQDDNAITEEKHKIAVKFNEQKYFKNLLHSFGRYLLTTKENGTTFEEYPQVYIEDGVDLKLDKIKPNDKVLSITATKTRSPQKDSSDPTLFSNYYNFELPVRGIDDGGNLILGTYNEVVNFNSKLLELRESKYIVENGIIIPQEQADFDIEKSFGNTAPISDVEFTTQVELPEESDFKYFKNNLLVRGTIISEDGNRNTVTGVNDSAISVITQNDTLVGAFILEGGQKQYRKITLLVDGEIAQTSNGVYFNIDYLSYSKTSLVACDKKGNIVYSDNVVLDNTAYSIDCKKSILDLTTTGADGQQVLSLTYDSTTGNYVVEVGTEQDGSKFYTFLLPQADTEKIGLTELFEQGSLTYYLNNVEMTQEQIDALDKTKVVIKDFDADTIEADGEVKNVPYDVLLSDVAISNGKIYLTKTDKYYTAVIKSNEGNTTDIPDNDRADLSKQNIPSFDGTKTNERPLYKTDAEGNFAAYIIQGNIWAKVPCKKYKLENGELIESGFTKSTFWKKINSPMFQDDLRAFISNNDLSVVYSAIDNIHYGALNSTDGMFKTISTLSEYNDLTGDDFTNVVSIYNSILSNYTKVLDFDTFYSYATTSKTEEPLTFTNNNNGKGTLKMSGFIVENGIPNYSTSNKYEIELNLSTKDALEDAYKEYLYAIARYVCFETEFITSLESVPVKLEFTESKLYVLSNKGTLSCIEKDDIIDSNDPSKWTHFSIPSKMYFTAYSEKQNRVSLKYNGKIISFNGDFVKEQVPIYNVKGLYTDDMKAIIYGSILSQDDIAELYKEKRIEIDVDAETNKIIVNRGSTIELSSEETKELADLQAMSKSKTNTSLFAAFGEGGILMLSKVKESSDWSQDTSKDYSFNNVIKMNKVIDGVSRDIYQYYIRIGNKINGRFAGKFADEDLSELNFYNFEENDVRLYNSSFSTVITSPDAGSNINVYKADTSESTVILPEGFDQDNPELLKSYELLVESSQALSVNTTKVLDVAGNTITFKDDLVSYNGNITVILSLLTAKDIVDQKRYISEDDIRKVTINGVVPLKLTTQVEGYELANKMYNKRCILNDLSEEAGYPSYDERPDAYKQKLVLDKNDEYVAVPEYYKNAFGNDITLTDYSASFSYYESQNIKLSDNLLESYNNSLPYLLAPIPLNNVNMYSTPFKGFALNTEGPLFLDNISTIKSNFVFNGKINNNVLNYLFTDQESDAVEIWRESKGVDDTLIEENGELVEKRFIYKSCLLDENADNLYLYDNELKCFVIRDDITCSGKVKLPYKFDASLPFKESELSNISKSDNLPTNIYYNKFGYGGNIEGTIGLPWNVDKNAFNTEEILVNKKGDPLVLSYYDGSPLKVKDVGEIVIKPNALYEETTTATKFIIGDFVFEPKKLVAGEIGRCKKGDVNYYFECKTEAVEQEILDVLGDDAQKSYTYIEEIEDYKGEYIEPIMLDNDYIDISPASAFIYDDNYNLSFTNKTDKHLLITTNVEGLVYSRAPKYNNYRELLSSEGRSIIYEQYDLKDKDVTVKSVNDDNIELSTSLESLGILPENNKGLSLKLTLKTQSTITYTSKADLDERENYIEIQESEINNFPPDRVYFNPIGYPKSPVLVDGNKFYSENSSYFGYTDYTNNNNEPIYCCNEQGKMIKLSIVDNELNESLLAENDTLLNCWVPKTPIYTSCREWFYNDYYVKGLEKNPYWQEIEIDSTLSDQGTFEQFANVYRFVKKGAKMVPEKVPEGRKLLNINNPVSYIISGDSYIVNRKENFLDLQNGRIRLLLTEPDEYYRHNENLIEYGISAKNILVEQDNSRNIIAPVDIRKLSSIWEDNSTIKYSGFLQASYTVNTTKSFTNNKKSDNSVVRVSELGLFNKKHELIAYATFPPIEYNSDTQHISFTMFIKNGTLSEIKKE